MSSFRDRLKQGQGTQNESPKLGAKYHFEMKKNEARNNEVGFAYSVKGEDGKYTTKFMHKPIEGIFLGTAMRLFAYSDDLGKSGGTYKSDYYWNSKHIKVYDPVSRKVAVEGAMEDVEKFCATAAEGKPSKRQVIFMITKQGIITVTTNLSIAIDQLGGIKRELLDKKLVLTPELFSETSNVSSNAQSYLGKFIKKNPPLFANATLGGEISDKDVVDYDAEVHLDNYKTWLDYKQQDPSMAKNEIPGANPSSYNPYTDFNVDTQQDARDAGSFGNRPSVDDDPFAGDPTPKQQVPQEEEDDLPW